MARVKKSRKSGLIGTPKESSESRGKKKPATAPKHKRKSGNAAGTRQNLDIEPGQSTTHHSIRDKRLGSKKPISLIAEKSNKKSSSVPRRQFATPEQELNVLEADQRFNRLLDQLEDEQKLSNEDQIWLDQQLARHKVLCDLLGITDQPDDTPEDDPFSQVDAIHLDDFKD
jgi:hypothetical protein